MAPPPAPSPSKHRIIAPAARTPRAVPMRLRKRLETAPKETERLHMHQQRHLTLHIDSAGLDHSNQWLVVEWPTSKRSDHFVIGAMSAT